MQMKPLMEGWRASMNESRNTHGADINEILFAFMAADKYGAVFVNDQEARDVLAAKTKKVKPAEYKDQEQRAVKALETTLDWAAQNGFDGSIKGVWWTARPNVLAAAVRLPLDAGEILEASPGNPTDVLFQFDDKKFLGVSLKSMKALTGDIGFKNPGVGAIGNSLGINLIAALNNMDKIALDRLKIPKLTQKKRKAWLRAAIDPKTKEVLIPERAKIKAETEKVGKIMLTTLRDVLLAHLEVMNKKNPDDVRKHILSQWMDAGDLYPVYVKVTGRGTAAKGYNASASDPNKNDQFKALMAADSFKFRKKGGGDDWEATIGVEAIAAGKATRILKMRFKFESEKLASSLKMSGDPYK